MYDNKFISELMLLAFEAGKEIMAVDAQKEAIQLKGDGSPVTKADKAAETVILEGLNKIIPNVIIISEENSASHQIKAPDCFILVDPLDGTKEFIKNDGSRAFTVNIALIEYGTPVLGVVYAPAMKRIFVGIKGQGAFESKDLEAISSFKSDERKPLYVRDIPVTGATAVASVSHRDEKTNQWLVDNNISETVSIGSSLKFCLVAAGEADVYPRFGPTMEWDTAAGDAVLRAAGGRVTDNFGVDFKYGKPDYRNGSFIALGKFSP